MRCDREVKRARVSVTQAQAYKVIGAIFYSSVFTCPLHPDGHDSLCSAPLAMSGGISDLRQEPEKVTGHDQPVATEQRVERLEGALRPVFDTLPMDSSGRLGFDGVHYAVSVWGPASASQAPPPASASAAATATSATAARKKIRQFGVFGVP